MCSRVIRFLFLLVCVFAERYDNTEQCSWLPDEDSSSSSKLSVTCRVRSLDKSTTNITSLPVEVTSRLRILCDSGSSTVDSSIPPFAFQRLHELVELRVSNCKLHRLEPNSFNGLYNLKKLAINTFLWGKSLELSSASLMGLKEVQVVDLSENSIRVFPDGAFCSLTNLHTLNLSCNHIRTPDKLGFDVPECSSSEIHSLDLSHNDLTSLSESSGFSRLRRLQLLNLKNNNISIISSESLTGLVSLKFLNLSNNRIESLPQGLFAGCRELREIYLQNNSLYSLAKGIFHRLEQLLVLDLSGNQLTSKHIDSGTFLGLIRLIILNLSHNAITHLDGRTFKDLFFLQILDLRNNSIGFIENNAFLPLYNLHTLNLAENRLNTIGPLLFNGLFVLSKLTLNNNLIANIDGKAFHNCSALKDLDLSSNALVEVPEAIQELTFLKSLDLGENQISEFQNGSFKNLNQLTGLRLIDNTIGNLTRGMLWDLPSLQVLNLAKNKIQGIERGTFERNTQLEAIRLDENYINDINGIFATLASLLWLNLSDNHLVWFDYAFIPKNLKWLDIHGNFIEHLGNYYKIQDEIRINTLDASHNRITEIAPMAIPNSIEFLFINNNFIKVVHPNTFLDKTSLTRVDMYANELVNVDLNSLRLSAIPTNRSLPEVYLGGNPFHCDCTMEWLQIINNMSTSRQYPRVMDLDNVVCKMTHSSRGVSHLPLNRAKPGDFLCTYETHCFALCHCCEFDACDCEMTCPKNCSCYHDQTWNTNVVDCSRQSALEIPHNIPMDATEVFLDGNKFKELQNHVFIGRKNMRALYVNNSEIQTIQNSTFNGLHALRALHLEDNHIKELKGYEFEHLTNLKELYLQNNLLTYIENRTLEPIKSLEILRLDGNKLTTIHMWLLTSNTYLTEATLAGNPWSCRCKFLQDFTVWVADNAVKVTDVADISCLNADSSPPERREIDFNATVCSDFYAGRSVIDSMLVSDYWPMVVLTLCIVILLLLVTVLWFVFRDSLRVWLYSRYGVRLCSFRAAAIDYENRDKLYDAFVCYSPKDEEWVMQALCAELESKFQLCLQQRDFPPGAYLHHAALAIIEAAEASRRVIIVLTRNFLQTEWSRFELRQSLHEVLKARVFKLVILEEGSLPEAELDPELRPYLKTAHRVRWGEKRFWEKLQYAMPSVDSRGKINANYRRNINNYTIDSRVMTNGSHRGHHHHHQQHSYPEKIKTQAPPPSPGAQMLPPPAYTHSEQEEANYSSATTATPSPRPSRRLHQEQRPVSDHIYSSIDSDYSTLERGGSGRRGGPPWRPHVLMQTTNNGGQAYLV